MDSEEPPDQESDEADASYAAANDGRDYGRLETGGSFVDDDESGGNVDLQPRVQVPGIRPC